MNRSNQIKMLLSLMLVASGLQAMEAPTPMEMGDETIILISADGKRFEVPAGAALRSPTIATTLGRGEFAEFQPSTNQVELGIISAQTLEILIPLLVRLDQLLSQNESADKINQIYVPRVLQPFINQRIDHLANDQLGALYQAADFLNMPFLLNGFASVMADRMHKGIPGNWQQLTQNQRESFINEKAAQLFGIHVGQEYILKHLVFRSNGITQEYSIFDYIAEHGQPQLVTKYQRNNSLDLDRRKITSLFGIDALALGNQVQHLFLSSNCLYDITLDVQLSERPFAGLAQLQGLWLNNNQLNNLPEQVFAGLGRLRQLYLDGNQLNNLPEQVFAGLAQLQGLWLNNNQLNNLPEQVFAGLAQLQQLSLDNNQLNNLPEQAFAGLAQLQQLSLSNNQLNNFPEQVFAGLAQLQQLFLDNNQLNNLPEHLFAGLAQLQGLYLYNNQLNNLPEHVFAGLAQLQGLHLRNNQLNNQEKQRIREQLPGVEIDF